MIVDGVLNKEKEDPTKWTKIVSKETNYSLEQNMEIDPKTGAPFPVPSLKIKEEIIETYIIPENSKLKEIREDEPGIFTMLNPF